jgi:hypothetical protein
MGDNVWRDAQTWPPEGFTPTSFYLSSQGKANSRQGDGRLTREAPRSEQAADTFHADPAQPSPSNPITKERPLKAAVWGPVDQRATEDRKDILVYTSEPLTAPLTFAGNAEAKLYVSTDTPDADWAVKLIDVHPDGFAQNIARGIFGVLEVAAGYFLVPALSANGPMGVPRTVQEFAATADDPDGRQSRDVDDPLFQQVPRAKDDISLDERPISAKRFRTGYEGRKDVGTFRPLFPTAKEVDFESAPHGEWGV